MKRYESDLLLVRRTTPAPGIGAERRAGCDFLMVDFVLGILVGEVAVEMKSGVW